MDQFEAVSYEQAISLLRQHADKDVTLITAPFPGMSFQISGRLFVQEDGQFAFAVMADERLSVSVMPFRECLFQIPAGSGTVDTIICALGGPEPDQEVMMWMVRFA